MLMIIGKVKDCIKITEGLVKRHGNITLDNFLKKYEKEVIILS